MAVRFALGLLGLVEFLPQMWRDLVAENIGGKKRPLDFGYLRLQFCNHRGRTVASHVHQLFSR